MKLLTIYKFILSLTVLGMVSCQNFFDEYNPNKVSADSFPTNLEECNMVLTGLYNQLYDEDVISILYSSPSADIAFAGKRVNGCDNDGQETYFTYYLHALTTSHTQVLTKWDDLYTGVWRSNQVIEYLNRLDDSYKEKEEWTLQMAQARLFRGMFHYYLHTTYNEGKIVTFDFCPVEVDDFTQPLRYAKDVLEFIREDLNYARDNLPEKYETRLSGSLAEGVDQYTESEDQHRLTRGFATTLLGMSYMFEYDYSPENDTDRLAAFAEAEVYFYEVMTNGLYELASADDLFSTANGEFTTESIFEINYCEGLKSLSSNTSTYNTTHILGYSTVGYNGTRMTPSAWLVDEYQTEQMDLLDDRNWVYDVHGSLTSEECEPYGYDNEYYRHRKMPLRGSAMVATVIDEDTQYYTYSSRTEAITASLSTCLGYFTKYLYWDTDSETNSGDGSKQSGKNVVITRLSEIYLLYAEIKIAQGKTTEALIWINKIRERWGLKLLGDGNTTESGGNEYVEDVNYTDAATLLKHLQDIEKPLELSAEGHFIRNIDLRRWKMYADRYEYLTTQTYYLSSFDYYKYDDRDNPDATTTEKTGWVRHKDVAAGDINYDSEKEVTEYVATYTNILNDSENRPYEWWPIPNYEILNNKNLYDIVGK